MATVKIILSILVPALIPPNCLQYDASKTCFYNLSSLRNIRGYANQVPIYIFIFAWFYYAQQHVYDMVCFYWPKLQIESIGRTFPSLYLLTVLCERRPSASSE